MLQKRRELQLKDMPIDLPMYIYLGASALLLIWHFWFAGFAIAGIFFQVWIFVVGTILYIVFTQIHPALRMLAIILILPGVIAIQLCTIYYPALFIFPMAGFLLSIFILTEGIYSNEILHTVFGMMLLFFMTFFIYLGIPAAKEISRFRSIDSEKVSKVVIESDSAESSRIVIDDRSGIAAIVDTFRYTAPRGRSGSHTLQVSCTLTIFMTDNGSIQVQVGRFVDYNDDTWIQIHNYAFLNDPLCQALGEAGVDLSQ